MTSIVTHFYDSYILGYTSNQIKFHVFECKAYVQPCFESIFFFFKHVARFFNR